MELNENQNRPEEKSKKEREKSFEAKPLSNRISGGC
jgi:hypothetical protein